MRGDVRCGVWGRADELDVGEYGGGADVCRGGVVLGGVGEVFEEEGEFGGKLRGGAELASEVKLAQAGPALFDVDREFAGHGDVLEVDGFDPRTEEGKGFVNEFIEAVKAVRGVDHVDDVEVDAEGRAIDGAEEAIVIPGGVREDPRHGFEGVEGAGGADGVDDVSDDGDDEVEGVFVEVPGVGTVPLHAERSGDVDAAGGAGAICEREVGAVFVERGGSLNRVGGDSVGPDADLGDDDARQVCSGGEFEGVRLVVGRVAGGEVAGPVAEAEVFVDPLLWSCTSRKKNRSAESHDWCPFARCPPDKINDRR